jgi:hypothetical protein
MDKDVAHAILFKHYSQPVRTITQYRKAFEQWVGAVLIAHGIKGPAAPGQYTRSARKETTHSYSYYPYLEDTLQEFLTIPFDILPIVSPEESSEIQEAHRVLEVFYQEPVRPINRYCDMVNAWARQAQQQVKNIPIEDQPHWIQGLACMLDVAKSSLLDRLLYGGETFRTRPCPEHRGLWSGLSGKYDGGCSHGCDLTGWLPEGLTAQDITNMIEERRQKEVERVQNFIAENSSSPFTNTTNPQKAYEEFKERSAKELGISVKELENNVPIPS